MTRDRPSLVLEEIEASFAMKSGRSVAGKAHGLDLWHLFGSTVNAVGRTFPTGAN